MNVVPYRYLIFLHPNKGPKRNSDKSITSRHSTKHYQLHLPFFAPLFSDRKNLRLRKLGDHFANDRTQARIRKHEVSLFSN